MTQWGEEPHTMGSYSFVKTGATFLENVRALAAPDWDSKLFFAGECCSEDNFTMLQGAVETGKFAAREVSKLLREGEGAAAAVQAQLPAALAKLITSDGSSLAIPPRCVRSAPLAKLITSDVQDAVHRCDTDIVMQRAMYNIKQRPR